MTKLKRDSSKRPEASAMACGHQAKRTGSWLGWIALVGLATPPCLHATAIWITSPSVRANSPVVLHFRREFTLSDAPRSLHVRVSADNRYSMYVNGTLVSRGPARGDLEHWRYEEVDIAPYLRRGPNVVAAEVWNTVSASPDLINRTSPFAQISAKTAFWLECANTSATQIDSGSRWRVAVEPGRSFSYPLSTLWKRLPGAWYAAGSAEHVDANKIDWGWKNLRESAADWQAAIPALTTSEVSPWTMVPDELPTMAQGPAPAPRIVGGDLFRIRNRNDRFPIEVPANADRSILIDQSEVFAGYPRLVVSGGKGSTITVTYAEALYDEQGHKGDRSEIVGRQAIGLEDTFVSDGGKRRLFEPLWWRTWRFVNVRVRTGSQPISIDSFSADSTGYPFQKLGYFRSNDRQLNRIWEIGWRTLKLDSHETYMDSSYWEQLQYVGDSRIEAIIADSVAGDPRLTRQAIDAFGESQRTDGMIQSAYPSSTDNVIPPFGLLWIGMMHDYWMRQPDVGVISRNLSRTRKVLDWYGRFVASNGLLSRNPEWNFVDWVGDPPIPRDKFPSFDTNTGTSCLTTLLYLGALREASDLEQALGMPARVTDYLAKADALAGAIRSECWDERRGLFADDPSRSVFSQHANSLAVLYDVSKPDKSRLVLDKIVSGSGIDAPDGVLASSYYFSWYLIRAFDHAGYADKYLRLLGTWRDLEGRHFTSWPESRGNSRSDTHAWSAHPTADLLSIVAGVRPAAPGYQRVYVSPHLGDLTSLESATATPAGLVRMHFRSIGKSDRFMVELPLTLHGTFCWKGGQIALSPGRNVFSLPAVGASVREREAVQAACAPTP